MGCIPSIPYSHCLAFPRPTRDRPTSEMACKITQGDAGRRGRGVGGESAREHRCDGNQVWGTSFGQRSGLVTLLIFPVPTSPLSNAFREELWQYNVYYKACIKRLAYQSNKKSNQRHEKRGGEQGGGGCELFLKGKHQGKENNPKDESSLVLQ